MSDTVTISKKAPLRVATWSELEDRVPAYALALQTDLVVIRLGDEVSVLYGRCLHRGALMADGRIEGDNLICGLHGWDYRVDTGVSAYANDEILHRFDARIDPSEDAVFIEEADVRAFQRVHPQPYDREAYLGLYQDPHGAPEEDVNGYIQRLAREGYSEAGVPSQRVRTIAGAALDVLPRLTDGHYDLVFCDGDKREYAAYLSEALRLLRPGGVVAFDNALWHDRVADPSRRDEETVAIRELNRSVAEHDSLLSVLLPVGDGLLAAKKVWVPEVD